MAIGFFETFTRIPYDLVRSNNYDKTIVINILARVNVIKEIMNNSYVYYRYDVKDGETPETIAYKYYGSSARWWIVMMANNIIDPNYDWVLAYDVFEAFVAGKYGSVALAKSGVHHYEKVITKIDSVSSLSTESRHIIDLDTYTSMAATEIITLNLTDNSTVHTTITKESKSNYDYEYDLNEGKRSIKIIDKQYVSRIEKELQKLMRS